MSDVGLVAILVAFFLLAIWLVKVLGRMIDRDSDPERLDEAEEFADEPPDTSQPRVPGSTLGGPR